jgi:hypothetical protein
MRLLTMPTSQDCHVVIIDGPLAIRHRRAAKPGKIAIGIIADRALLGAKPTGGSAARGRGFGEELPPKPSLVALQIYALSRYAIDGWRRPGSGPYNFKKLTGLTFNEVRRALISARLLPRKF